jgi:hypothetical protein
MLKADWSYPIDIWSVGVMVCLFALITKLFDVSFALALIAPFTNSVGNSNQIWDLFEDRHLFYGNDPDGRGYTTRAHLAEMIGILGPHPKDLINQGARSHEFFTEDSKCPILLTINLPYESNFLQQDLQESGSRTSRYRETQALRTRRSSSREG